MFADTGLTAATLYYYRVQARNNGGATPGPSAAATTRPIPGREGAPWNSHWGGQAWFYYKDDGTPRALYGSGQSGPWPTTNPAAPTASFVDVGGHHWTILQPQQSTPRLYYYPASGLLGPTRATGILRVMLAGYNFEMERINRGPLLRPRWLAHFTAAQPDAAPGIPPEAGRIFDEPPRSILHPH